MKRQLLIATAAALMALTATPLHALKLGEWTHHYAYNDLTQVVPTSNTVYALSAGRLFSYSPNDDSVTEYNTTNLLNDANSIGNICWNRQTQCLVIVYSNGNIDMLSTRDGSIVNNAAILNETTTRSKEIKDIMCDGIYAYLVMDYGAIQLNTSKREFGDMYTFSDGGSFTGAWVENDSLFLQNTDVMPSYGSSMIAGRLSDNLLDKTLWKPVANSRRGEIESKILDYRQQRCTRDISGQSDANSYVRDQWRGCYWSAAGNGSLMRFTRTDDNTFTPDWQSGRKPYGPTSNDFYNMHWLYGRLYTVGRGWRTKQDSFNPGMIQVYEPDKGWCTYETPDKNTTGVEFLATSDIAIDPRDTSHVMVSAKSGVYEYMNGRFVKHWNSNNSTIKPLSDGTSLDYQMVLTSAYTADGTLWVMNTGTSMGLHKLTQTLSNGEVTESSWQPVPHQEISVIGNRGKSLSNAKVDSRGHLWFINLSWLDADYFCYEPSTDRLTVYTPDYNQDGVRMYNSSGDGYLRDINIDTDGNVWLCGTKGVCYLPAAEVGNATNRVEQYKVPRNDGTGLADYLLATVDATCIIFDSAGRKYVGTDGNGIFVISTDNNEELQNYTTANSHIMSNNVRYLALDEKTGTLYCSTDRGLCSVRTDAITVPSTLDKNNIRVYPNPVRPEYTGMITFEGLTVGADIKITTATGAIVHTGRSTSAIYQWDGCDLSGNRCASGVYNVLLATDDGSEGCVAKVAMVK